MRKPDLPCSKCEKLMWRGNGTLPEGLATCRKCREANRSHRVVEKTFRQEWNCEVCGVLYVAERWGGQLPDTPGRFCAEHQGSTHCGTCGEWTVSSNPYRKTTKTYCSDICRSLRGKSTSTSLDWRDCICGRPFCHPSRKYCQPECKNLKRRPCPDCGTPLEKNRQRCEPCREAHAAVKKATRPKPKNKLNKYRKRARHYGVPYEPVNRKEVFIRDGWICGICKDPVDKNLKYPDAMSASLDHVIPMARGGPHSYANTQCAHFICNSIKSDRLEEELVA